jgi:putative membrane protein
VTRLLATFALSLVGVLLFGISPAAAEDAPAQPETAQSGPAQSAPAQSGAAEPNGQPAATQPGDEPAPGRFSYNGPVGSTLDPTDRVFLQLVRQAGMWERPAGAAAQRKGLSARTREVGRLIEIDHQNLDDDVIKIGQRLGVEMPTQPTPFQMVFLSELDAATGAAFDAKFAQLLRDAHGGVFQLIAQIRANSRNDLVRAFASHANEVVHRHMWLLESTNNVSYDLLPKAKGSTGRTRPFKQEPMFVFALIAIAGAVGFTGVMRAVRA